MAKIVLVYRQDFDKQGRSMPTYNGSMDRALVEQGHKLTRVGIGQPKYEHVDQMPEKELKSHDLLIDVDCGRGKDGKLHFQYYENKCPIPNAVRFIDTHGYPSLHRRLAKNYQHVFFAVFRRRDLFSKHPSSHWCPNASDTLWFDYVHHLYKWRNPKRNIGFFGSKGGLDRTDDLITVCDNRELCTYDVREVGQVNRARWPRTAQAMANCKILFNRGQKHDGPNQRVIESMLMARPLITDRDKTDGMDQLFEEGKHYLGYERMEEIGVQLDWCLTNKDLAIDMAIRAYEECKENHLVEHRVEQILNICLT